MSKDSRHKLGEMLRELKLPGVHANFAEAAIRAEKEGWGFERFLHHILEVELEQRRQKRLERVLKASKLPVGKTLATLDQAVLPIKVRRQLPALMEGGFVDLGENLLAFGLPGRGKSHLVCALGTELIQQGYTVYFTPAFALVQPPVPTMLRQKVFTRLSYGGHGRNGNVEGREFRKWRGLIAPAEAADFQHRVQAEVPGRG